MSKRQQLEELLNNPNAQKMLNLIASAEGVKHGYNTIFGNERFSNLSAHPNVLKRFKQTDGKVNYTTAAGRYQFLKPTWDGLVRQYGLTDFSPRNQDLGALALIKQRGALNDVLKGDYRSAINKLGKEWASLPSSPYAQPKRSQAEIDKFLGGARTTNQYQPNYISDDKVEKLFPNKSQSQYQPKYLPEDQVAKLFPNQPTQQAYTPQYLSDEQVASLFPKG